MMHQSTIKATILYENAHWIGIFERLDEKGMAVTRKIFGSEPSDAECYDFVLHHYHELNFSQPVSEFKLIIKRKNPKRVLREVKKEMRKLKEPVKMSRAQELLKLELEKNKKIKKATSSAEKLARQKTKFALKQAKKKQKHRGH